eukprot:TRINITY_DN65382_c0_g1_i1.p1 TRINITY_DN65382_c0_g1~~TRINITY_DN65382_c0_g1_i1.p1  ORF type:complete len:459 (-),score=85.86 TRINITY_DN65382_c0_g1_i1:619-1995(-)
MSCFGSATRRCAAVGAVAHSHRRSSPLAAPLGGRRCRTFSSVPVRSGCGATARTKATARSTVTVSLQTSSPPARYLTQAPSEGNNGASAASQRSSNGGSGPVTLSKKRLETLLEAELVHFAKALAPHPLTLQEILAYQDPEELRKLLLADLPIRFARRVQLIESLKGWDRYLHLSLIRSIYADAFRRMRNAQHDDARGFRQALVAIRKRTDNVVSHIMRGTRSMRDDLNLSDETVTDFLDQFLMARIGSDVLTSQYLALTRPAGARSVIDPQCNPERVARRAGEDATLLCEHHYGFSPPLQFESFGDVRFPFIPEYLRYVMFEIIKNSLRAVAELYGDAETAAKHPVKVIVCGDEDSVVLKVSDEGGGIPLESLDKAWSYLYTTAKPQADDTAVDEAAPMAGFGCGLPLSRNYVSYVGGRLDLATMPHHGTDAYAYFNRTGEAQESERSNIAQHLAVR